MVQILNLFKCGQMQSNCFEVSIGIQVQLSGETATISFDISGAGHAEIESQTISVTSCSVHPVPPVILHVQQISSPSWQENQLIQKMELPNFLPHYLRLIIEMWNDLLYFSSKSKDASWLSVLNSHYIIFPFAKVRVKPGGDFCSGKAPYRLNGILSDLKREGEKEKERAARFYLMEKSYFSGGDRLLT